VPLVGADDADVARAEAIRLAAKPNRSVFITGRCSTSLLTLLAGTAWAAASEGRRRPKSRREHFMRRLLSRMTANAVTIQDN